MWATVWLQESSQTSTFGLSRVGSSLPTCSAAGEFEPSPASILRTIPSVTTWAVSGWWRTAPSLSDCQSALPLLLQTILGLQPVAPLHLLAVDPMLPPWLPEITIERLRLGDTTATLRFHREKDGKTEVDVVRKQGPLRVIRQPPPESLSADLGDRFRALFDSILPW